MICQNRKAHFNYHFIDRFEAGIVLTGTEIKSIRQGKVTIQESYGIIQNEECFLLNMNISPFSQGGIFNHEPTRKRKLLLHKNEIKKLIGQIQARGLTLVPLKLYLKNGRAKIELALGKGKKLGDKRETVKKRDTQREIRSMLKPKNRR